MDLDAYLARIGYTGSREPTFEVLEALSLAHVCAVPFENLDVILERGIDLDPIAVEKKIVGAGRGGYCFEQNALFLDALTALGFSAKLLSARVRLNRPKDFVPARTHTFLRVSIGEEEWLADVGVGAASLTTPIRFGLDGVVQPTQHESRRLVRDGARWIHQIQYGDEWTDVYEFTGEEMPFIDRVVANWYTSTYPTSHFRDRVMVARALPGRRRITLLNRELSVRDTTTGNAEKRTLDSFEEWQRVLGDDFGLHIDGLALTHATGPTLLGRLLA